MENSNKLLKSSRFTLETHGKGIHFAQLSIFYDYSTCKCDDGKCVKALVEKEKITEHAITSCATQVIKSKSSQHQEFVTGEFTTYANT